MILKDLISLWLNYRCHNITQRTNQYTIHLLNKHFCIFNNLEIDEIKPFDIYQILCKLESKHEAKRAVALLSNVISYGRVMGYVNKDPTKGISKFLGSHTTKPRPAIIEPNKVGILLKDIDSIRNKTISNAIKMIIFTAQRRTEVIAAKWEEFDLEKRIWTIPAHRMKMKNAHIVPITSKVLSVLKKQKNSSEYVFVSSKRKNQHISQSGVLSALHTLGYKGEQTLHGFRSTFSTLTHDSQLFSIDAIEAQLAHKINGVRGVYNRGNYLTERIKMMEWYEEFLQRLKNQSC